MLDYLRKIHRVLITTLDGFYQTSVTSLDYVIGKFELNRINYFNCNV